MSKTLTALFDGQVFHPDIPPDLEPNTHYIILVQPVHAPGVAVLPQAALPRGVPGVALLPFTGTWDLSDLQVVAEAIEEACEQVNMDEW